MAVLKKIKGESLIGSIAATVIVMSIFVISSLVIKNVLFSTSKKDTSVMYIRIDELGYFASHGAIKLPYFEVEPKWEISIEKTDGYFVIEGLHKSSNQRKIKYIANN